MWVTIHDENEGLAVWAMTDATNEDWRRAIEAMRAITTFPRPNGRRPAVILFAENSAPPATARAAIGDVGGMKLYDPYLAFVTTNTFVRTVMNMFKWFHRPNYEYDVFGKTRPAKAWLEQKRGTKLPALDGMVAKVAEEMPFVRALSG